METAPAHPRRGSGVQLFMRNVITLETMRRRPRAGLRAPRGGGRGPGAPSTGRYPPNWGRTPGRGRPRVRREGQRATQKTRDLRVGRSHRQAAQQPQHPERRPRRPEKKDGRRRLPDPRPWTLILSCRVSGQPRGAAPRNVVLRSCCRQVALRLSSSGGPGWRGPGWRSPGWRGPGGTRVILVPGELSLHQRRLPHH